MPCEYCTLILKGGKEQKTKTSWWINCHYIRTRQRKIQIISKIKGTHFNIMPWTNHITCSYKLNNSNNRDCKI